LKNKQKFAWREVSLRRKNSASEVGGQKKVALLQQRFNHTVYKGPGNLTALGSL